MQTLMAMVMCMVIMAMFKIWTRYCLRNDHKHFAATQVMLWSKVWNLYELTWTQTGGFSSYHPISISPKSNWQLVRLTWTQTSGSSSFHHFSTFHIPPTPPSPLCKLFLFIPSKRTISMLLSKVFGVFTLENKARQRIPMQCWRFWENAKQTVWSKCGHCQTIWTK